MIRHREVILNFRDKYKKDNLLHFIVSNIQSCSILKAVLPYSSSLLNEININGYTALHYACSLLESEYNLKFLTILLEQPNIDVYKQTNNEHLTALHVAAKLHRSEYVTKLLSFDKNLAYAWDENGDTPLRYIFKEYRYVQDFSVDTWLRGALYTLQSFFSYDVMLVKQKGYRNRNLFMQFQEICEWVQNHELLNRNSTFRNRCLYIVDRLISQEISSAETKTRSIIFIYFRYEWCADEIIDEN
jgi:hypothetical protein